VIGYWYGAVGEDIERRFHGIRRRVEGEVQETGGQGLRRCLFGLMQTRISFIEATE